jgi:hypothetical protein
MQAVASLLAVAPSVEDLSGHLMHAFEATVSEYWPTKQLLHLSPALAIVPKKPRSHWQAVMSKAPVDPAAVFELAGHGVHEALSTPSAYCPAGHCVHLSVGSLIVPLEPAEHWQSVTDLLEVATVVEPSGHGVHGVTSVCALYCPISHAVHVSDGAAIVPAHPAWHTQSDAAVQAPPSPSVHPLLQTTVVD